MGNKNESISKVETDVRNYFNSTLNQEFINSCQSSISGINKLIISDSTVSDTVIDMKNDIKTSCYLQQALDHLVDTSSNISLATRITEAQLNSSIMSANKSNTELYSLLKNNVDINELIRVVNECIQKMDFINYIEITNSSILRSAITMNNVAFNECLQKSLLDLASKHSIDTSQITEKELSQKAESPFGSMFIIIGVIILVVGFLLYKFRKLWLGPLGFLI